MFQKMTNDSWNKAWHSIPFLHVINLACKYSRLFKSFLFKFQNLNENLLVLRNGNFMSQLKLVVRAPLFVWFWQKKRQTRTPCYKFGRINAPRDKWWLMNLHNNINHHGCLARSEKVRDSCVRSRNPLDNRTVWHEHMTYILLTANCVYSPST